VRPDLVGLAPEVEHDAPHAHVDGEEGAQEEWDRHAQRARDVVLHPPPPRLGHLLERADGDGEEEEGEAEAEAVLGELVPPVDAQQRDAPVDLGVRRRVPFFQPDVVRLVEDPEHDGADDAAEAGAHHLAHEHGPRRGQRQVPRLEVLDEVGGRGDDAHHQPARRQTRHHAAVRRTHARAEDEDGQLAVAAREGPVRQPRPVRVAEGEHRRHHVRPHHVLRLQLTEDVRDRHHRDRRKKNVRAGGDRRRDLVLEEHL